MNSDEYTKCWSALFMGLGNAEFLGFDLRERFEALESLKASVNRVINFGCWAMWNEFAGYEGGVEPFALAWTLDATEVFVVDKNSSYLEITKRRAEELERHVPRCLEGHSLTFLPKDMTEEITELPSEYFDLSYCERVLLQVHEERGKQGLEKAITLMARILKPGGWVVACEQPTGYLPENMAYLFENSGLELDQHINKVGILKDAYVYRKPLL